MFVVNSLILFFFFLRFHPYVTQSRWSVSGQSLSEWRGLLADPTQPLVWVLLSWELQREVLWAEWVELFIVQVYQTMCHIKYQDICRILLAIVNQLGLTSVCKPVAYFQLSNSSRSKHSSTAMRLKSCSVSLCLLYWSVLEEMSW